MVELYPGFGHKPAVVSCALCVLAHLCIALSRLTSAWGMIRLQMRAYKAADRDGNGFVTRREFKKVRALVTAFPGVFFTAFPGGVFTAFPRVLHCISLVCSTANFSTA